MRSNKLLTLWIAGLIILVFGIQNIFSVDLAWTVGTISWKFFSAMIAHSGIAHLLGNLFGLVVFGLILEETIGTKRYALVLITAGIVGNLAGIGSYTKVLGISGVVYGIFGALAVLRPKMVVWASGLPMPMVVAAAGWAFVDFLGLFANTNTGHLAHLAGIVAGIIYGFAWRNDFSERPKRRRGMDRGTKERIDRALDDWEHQHMR